MVITQLSSISSSGTDRHYEYYRDVKYRQHCWCIVHTFQNQWVKRSTRLHTVSAVQMTTGLIFYNTRFVLGTRELLSKDMYIFVV